MPRTWQDRSMKQNEPKRAVALYEKDVDLIKSLRDKHPGMNLADAARVCIEYARAHGVIDS